jgi:hypothetical protein
MRIVSRFSVFLSSHRYPLVARLPVTAGLLS